MTTEQNTTDTTKHEAPAVATEREQSGQQGFRRETGKAMTDIIDECPAAAIGRRLAENDPKLEDYDMSAREVTGFAKIAFDNALQDAYDTYSHLQLALSHEKAKSMDGAAVQVAAIYQAVLRLSDVQHNFEREEAKRAISRMSHSVLSFLMDRVEADWITSGVESLASSMHNPWVEPDIRIQAVQDADELEREQRQARSGKAA